MNAEQYKKAILEVVDRNALFVSREDFIDTLGEVIEAVEDRVNHALEAQVDEEEIEERERFEY